jgi:NAD(P)-dependent dehydrogenase (short-subunit alcohol dehydrogenase family)
MKTVLITGSSSGYGLETACHFHAQGWNVIATMRNPRENVLPRSERLRVVTLDVTKPHSIATALEATVTAKPTFTNLADVSGVCSVTRGATRSSCARETDLQQGRHAIVETDLLCDLAV